MAKTHAPIVITRAETKAERDAFIRVPFELYKGDPNWVPQLNMERREHLDPKKNPYFDHATVALWIASRDGRPVGRISAQICDLHLARYNDTTGHFGMFETIDDQQVASELLATASQWLADQGMKRMVGPLSLSINDEIGLLVDGFNHPPAVMMNYAKPYYGDRLEQAGMVPVKDAYAFRYGRDLVLPRSLQAMVERAKASGDLEVRPFNMKKLGQDIEIVVDIFNEAWANNWGFVPMTEAEINALAANLKLLVTGRFGSIASYKGEPVAFAVTLPNINEAIADLNGKLLPFGWAKVLWRLKVRHPNSVRLLLMGVRKKYQAGVLGAALAASVIDPLRTYHRDRGSQWGELSWVLDDNEPMLALADFIGADRYKTYRFYEKAIVPSAPA